MYPHFIEVHLETNPDHCILINVEQIIGIGGRTIVIRGEYTFLGREIRCAESYTELKELIRSAGCAIRKADPRLDDRVPLGMDELCSLEMVGQPVWNSNTREWMLVIDSDHMHNTVDLIDNCGKIVRFEPHDVQKFPLYRMKREPCS